MKSWLVLVALGVGLGAASNAQDPSTPVLRPGVSVQMPVADHAVAMRAADELDATVVAITAGGKLYIGIQPAEPGALSGLTAETIYIKADARVPFQTVLTVLDALRGKSVVLLAASPATVSRAGIVPPYGIRTIVSR